MIFLQVGQYLIVLINKRLVPLVKDVDADRIKTGGGGGLGNKGTMPCSHTKSRILAMIIKENYKGMHCSIKNHHYILLQSMA